ncbi:NAD(P)-dependent oxidoreductase [Sulfitobacter albidus]|uniref:NAD(P)-dependent oxidoreductase n=1 Tax=Sulfitobacter albidus TaxID=2829501 RepID=A0A975JH44_9RHOB|nr:NAD(P)-dependent oxidoreductase [Sulfitobacter albidus]QUJ78101.1 NAD(P)-dependent oxidoreductase [Sulfitobacter albidus]
MGQHMARNLIAAGHEVYVWNRTAETAKDFAKNEACIAVVDPSDLIAQAQIVITMLADDSASDAVHLGEGGLFASTSGATLVEMGTMSPDHISELVARAPDKIRVIDAPVSGATKAAEDADLLIMAGCRHADPDLAAVFDALGRQTIYLGQSGAGAVMKLAVNSLIHGINQTLAEAMTLAEASGIAPALAFDVIEASAACAPMLKYRRSLYLNEAEHDVTFTVALARKDMEVTAGLADRLGTAMPQGRATLAKLIDAEKAGYGARDMASVLDFMRKERP